MTKRLPRPINWNKIEDETDLIVWNKLTQNFWLPEKIAVSNDLKSWSNFSDAEKDATKRVLAGLTLLDTVQGTVGAVSLIPDAETPHEEAVLGNIVFMEAFSGDTELLTPKGWKKIKEVTLEDEIAQYDPSSNEITFTHPTKVLDPVWYDETYEIVANNGNARQVVSGGHRVYLEEKKQKNNFCKEWESRTVDARDLLNINLNSAHRRFRSTGVAPSGDGMTAVDKLLVAVSADGSFKSGSAPRCTGEKTGDLPCIFSLSKDRKADRLIELANEAGWRIKERKRDKSGKRVLCLGVPLEYSESLDKTLGRWWDLNDISREWARDFVEECSLWDGHKLESGYGVVFYSTKKEESDFFVAVASLAGYKTRTILREDSRSESFADCWVTYASFSSNMCYSAQSMNVLEAEPQYMYCVQVPTTYLLTRNGESTVISGNCVHAKSYSSIFSTLCSTDEINDLFWWAETDEYLLKKEEIIMSHYDGKDPLKRKIASTMLESFLFYSGFYLPLYWASRARLTNTADIIKLIIADEAVHGYYIGYKYQKNLEKVENKEYYQDFTIGLLLELMDNEIKYTQSIYDQIGLTEDVLRFLKYNANKALMNLGYDPIYSSDQTKFSAGVMSSLGGGENHDFFSGSGSSYTMGVHEEMEDDDWDF